MEGQRLETEAHDEVTQAVASSSFLHSSSSQSPYFPFQNMESLLEKLKLLDYEKHFCPRSRIKGLSKIYFALPSNPGEQFNTFVSLAAWLINEAGGSIEPPQEYDDPNATIATILESLRTLMGQIPEFPPSKLKSGSGDYCVHVLSLLADAALKNKEIMLDPQRIDEREGAKSVASTVDESIVSTSEEGSLIEWSGSKGCAGEMTSAARGGFHCDSEVDVETADDDEHELTSVDTDHTPRSKKAFQTTHNQGENHTSSSSLLEEPTFIDPHGAFAGLLTGVGVINDSQQARETTVTSLPLPPPPPASEAGDWQLEVERVLPQLRLVTRSVNGTAGSGGSGAKDWRTHLEQIGKHRSAIEEAFASSRSNLKRLAEDLARGMDKIGSREKYVNSQIDSVLTEYRRAQDCLSEVKEAYDQASASLAERSQRLAALTAEVEEVKSEMEARGASMTDGSPVVRIKQAIQRLKAENVAMEIRTGVLEHTLLRLHLRAREESQKPLFAMRPSLLSLMGSSGGGGPTGSEAV